MKNGYLLKITLVVMGYKIVCEPSTFNWNESLNFYKTLLLHLIFIIGRITIFEDIDYGKIYSILNL